MTTAEQPSDLSMTYKAKRALVTTSLAALGAAYEILSKHSRALQLETAEWEDGRTFSIGVLPRGPAITIRKEGDRLVCLGRGDHDAPIKLLIKNMDSAVLMMTGKCPMFTATAERRVVIHGAIDVATQIGRTLEIVQSFLFPGFMLKHLSKRVPTFSRQELLLKARLYATIAPTLVGMLAK